MDDIAANRIVVFLLLLIILGIVLALHTLVSPSVYGAFVHQLKNNAGNYSTTNILMMVAVAIGLYLLITFLFTPKQDPTSLRRPKGK
jgi:uncharacterized membrane protein